MGVDFRRLGKASLFFPIATMALLTFLSSLPGEPDSDALLFYGMSIDLDPQVQNLIHIPAFLFLGLCWMFSFEVMQTPARKATTWTLLVGIAFGIFDEVHQAFVPYRYPGLLDALMDALGIVLACWFWSPLRGCIMAPRGT